MKYKRIVLKLSGEALSSKREKSVVDISSLSSISQEIKKLELLKVEIAIVVGGGNIWRGSEVLKEWDSKFNRITADYIGMIATTINALVLKDVFEKAGIEVVVLSAIDIPKICNSYTPALADEYLRKGVVVILAGGTGSPYFTTDTTAALRAVELNADVLLKATKVDGVYTKDPVKYPDAKKFSSLTFSEAIKRKLKIMDTTAFSLCMENNIKIIVFNLFKTGNIVKAAKGEKVGTEVAVRRQK
ncbi:MAG: UMP kinase [Elusimicrobiota bacterium]|nr:UMP kinase [Elusimicrobiota bacterium]